MRTVDAVDLGRRRFLTATATVVGGVGVAFVAVPFLKSWSPSERAQAAGAPVEADISKLEEGAMMTVEGRGKPVWLLKRTKKMRDDLPGLNDQLTDPACSPTFRPDVAPADLGPDWKGGYFCPCHGSRFDLAGRVYKGVPAPTNPVVPSHRFVSDSRVLIGVDPEAA